MSKVTQPDGGEVNSTYWPTGELKRTWGSRTYPVEYTYDDQGRMKTLTTWQDFAGDSGRAVTTWNYEPATGWLQQKLYDDGKGPSYSYSPAGRLLTRTWARKVNGQDLVTSYAYTTAGDLETVDYSNTPGPLKDVVYGYDRQGRQTSVTDSTGTRTTSYTAAGQPDAVTWQDGLLAGMTLDYTQDNLLRPAGYTLTRAAQPQPETVATASYGYDAAGRLHTVTAGTDVFSYSYLQNSSLVDTVTSRHGATEVMKTVKTWDNLNRLTSIENRNGADLPARVYSSHVYTYNNANQRTEALREDATKWAYGYDDLGQVTSGVKKKQDGTPLPGLSFGYLFDDIGNRKQATTSVGGVLRTSTYSATLLNQYTQRTVPGFIDLLGEAAPDATVTVNNQPTVRDCALFVKSLTVSNAAGAVNQDVHVVGVKNNVGPGGEDAVTEVQGKRFVPQTPEAFTYDDDGNMLTDGRWSYEWDAENRLVAMETLAGLPASVTKQRLEFAYDSQSRRVSKKVLTGTPGNWTLQSETRFVYDLWNLIAELPVLPAPSVKTYVWGLDLSGSLQGAGGVGGLLSSSSLSSSAYFAFDGNGNVVALVDATTGAESARYEYDPFGNVVLQTGTAAGGNTFRFSTKYHDSEAALVYYGYRYYAPGLGRWVSRDPLDETDVGNLLVYGGNSAVSYSDGLGLAAYHASMARAELGAEDQHMRPYGDDPLAVLRIARETNTSYLQLPETHTPWGPVDRGKLTTVNTDYPSRADIVEQMIRDTDEVVQFYGHGNSDGLELSTRARPYPSPAWNRNAFTRHNLDRLATNYSSLLDQIAWSWFELYTCDTVSPDAQGIGFARKLHLVTHRTVIASQDPQTWLVILPYVYGPNSQLVNDQVMRPYRNIATRAQQAEAQRGGYETYTAAMFKEEWGRQWAADNARGKVCEAYWDVVQVTYVSQRVIIFDP